MIILKYFKSTKIFQIYFQICTACAMQTEVVTTPSRPVAVCTCALFWFRHKEAESEGFWVGHP